MAKITSLSDVLVILEILIQNRKIVLLITFISMETPVSATPKAGNNKVAWFVAIIVLVGIIVALNALGDKNGESTLDMESSVTTEGSETETTTPSETATVVVNNDPDAALTYTAALTKYAKRRIEFSSACAATPSEPVYFDKTKVMLDNRGTAAVRITVGDKAFDIPSYNFAFITLTTSEPEIKLPVSCGTKANVATITVTK